MLIDSDVSTSNVIAGPGPGGALDLVELPEVFVTGTSGAAGGVSVVLVSVVVVVVALMVVVVEVMGGAEAVDAAASVDPGVRLGGAVGVGPVGWVGVGPDRMTDAQTAFSAVPTVAVADARGVIFAVRSTPGTGTAAAAVRR